MPAIATLLLSGMTAQPIDAAALGLNAVIEDDLASDGDHKLLGFRTKGCRTTITAKGRRWKIDWRRTDQAGFADNFIFISAPPSIKLAIVGDASIPDQAARLEALNDAIQAKIIQCSAKS
jgi:hypothetical protein